MQHTVLTLLDIQSLHLSAPALLKPQPSVDSIDDLISESQQSHASQTLPLNLAFEPSPTCACSGKMRASRTEVAGPLPSQRSHAPAAARVLPSLMLTALYRRQESPAPGGR